MKSLIVIKNSVSYPRTKQGNKMKKSTFTLLVVTILSFTSSASTQKQPGENIQKDNYYPQVKFETSMGDLVIELNRKRAPATVNNFLSYVKRGEFDNTLFHRVIPGYIVQGGGYGPEFKVKKASRTIINESGNGLKNEIYTIAMAREDDPHSAKRQFFFNMNDNNNLDPGKTWGYTVFGSVIEGTEVLDKIALVETEYKALIRFQDAPREDVMLIQATVLPEVQ
ncbi:MAG: peptidyl-prolyl cis-trans isomerase A (cyclophilin A) [Glaciecola sp.]|jgi:peptidyl-prolyl cis-trans isomerase A (cyclophilin A)